jgi:hypothetical protein
MSLPPSLLGSNVSPMEPFGTANLAKALTLG